MANAPKQRTAIGINGAENLYTLRNTVLGLQSGIANSCLSVGALVSRGIYTKSNPLERAAVCHAPLVAW